MKNIFLGVLLFTFACSSVEEFTSSPPIIVRDIGVENSKKMLVVTSKRSSNNPKIFTFNGIGFATKPWSVNYSFFNHENPLPLQININSNRCLGKISTHRTWQYYNSPAYITLLDSNPICKFKISDTQYSQIELEFYVKKILSKLLKKQNEHLSDITITPITYKLTDIDFSGSIKDGFEINKFDLETDSISHKIDLTVNCKKLNFFYNLEPRVWYLVFLSEIKSNTFMITVYFKCEIALNLLCIKDGIILSSERYTISSPREINIVYNFLGEILDQNISAGTLDHGFFK